MIKDYALGQATDPRFKKVTDLGKQNNGSLTY